MSHKMKNPAFQRKKGSFDSTATPLNTTPRNYLPSK
jgi:hypothetical protein